MINPITGEAGYLKVVICDNKNGETMESYIHKDSIKGDLIVIKLPDDHLYVGGREMLPSVKPIPDYAS